MYSGHLKRAGTLAAISVLGVTGLASVSASADPAPRAKAATLKMAADGKNLVFQGPKTVSAGSKLKIVNTTSPKKVGPHTFTLLKKKKLPTTKDEMKGCERFEGICGTIAEAHEVDPKTFQVGAPDVDEGKKGWDTRFGKSGDTWYTEEEGEIESRKVTAKPGALHYLCIVHPFMQGKIKVVK